MSGAIPPLPTGCHDLDVPCLMKVLEHLDARDLVRAACVHPLWRALASDEALWRTHLERDYATTSTRMPDGTSEPSCRCGHGSKALVGVDPTWLCGTGLQHAVGRTHTWAHVLETSPFSAQACLVIFWKIFFWRTGSC
jgi:hypothetical protein